MTSSVIAFAFEGTNVQAVNRDGDAWFVGMEVASALGYADTDKAVRTHCKAAEILKPADLAGLGIPSKSPRGLKLIPERDLYRLVMNSQKPSAIAFEEKVVGEILPAIRKSGGYMVAAPDETPEALAVRALTVLQATIDRQKVQLSIAQPMADALEDLASLKGFHTLTQSAKSCGWPRDEFIQECSARHWIYRDKAKKIWMGYADKEKAGLLDYKPFEYTSSDGHVKAKPQVVFTARGLAKIKLLIGVYPGKSAPVPFSRPKEKAS